jgi:hypothetical protein
VDIIGFPVWENGMGWYARGPVNRMENMCDTIYIT